MELYGLLENLEQLAFACQKKYGYISPQILKWEKKTGRKADTDQVALSMHNARNQKNDRLFEREEWLTKTQITGFFSFLASRQRSCRQDASSTDENFQPHNDENEDLEALIRESDRYSLINNIDKNIGLKHPISFDVYDLCDYYSRAKIVI